MITVPPTPTTPPSSITRRVGAAQAVVWISASDGSEVQCLELATALRRAANAVPQSFSLMVRASTLERIGPSEIARILGRAHRIVVCADAEAGRPAAPALDRAHVGYLPRPIAVDAFAAAIAWLAAPPPS